MSTDFQRARVALGARLRELRTEARTGGRLSGRALAERLGWVQSKVSKLESGRQTPTPADLEAWAEATGYPELGDELKARLRGLETTYRSLQRQFAAGHRVRQEDAVTETKRTGTIRAFESARIPGLLQTADYARSILTMSSLFLGTPRDTEDAVRARMQRQEALWQPGRSFFFLVWEAALHVAVSGKRRPVPLPRIVVAALRWQRLSQAEAQRKAGEKWEETGYVFTTRHGRPIEPTNLYRSFVRVSSAADVPAIRLHDARHGCATLLVASGVPPRVVMEILGHSQIGLTMNVYTHVTQDTQWEAISNMDRLLKRRH
ncbi:Scr1 family TA system antitoxin-like transcriptional regulator [Kitasatospora sp. NPDC052896]|uniref:Scr1 family TA system antitoxin-like transcriptional regulator n=1 Tax=Kitasatospora sp. NPDC052896 TaxID=3364061 RepID=UPI0037CBC6F2